MDWLLAETPYHSPYFARKCLGLKRTTIPTSWDNRCHPTNQKGKNGLL